VFVAAVANAHGSYYRYANSRWSGDVVADLISIIVATYNRQDALDAVLRSLAQQSERDFEVLVADDGSKPQTKAVVDDWKRRVKHRLVHVWHPDQGFRLAEIRNRAILVATGDYCIFLDGDCIARTNFVAAHRALARRRWFVTGNRILMSRALSERILREKLEPERWGFADWLHARRSGGINRLAPLASLPLGPLRKLRARAWRGALGCNLGIWRSDLVAVDGFDGDFNSWGREDSDLLVRLMRAGVRRKDGRMATGVLHLWHPEADRSRLPENERRLDSVLTGDRIRATRGLSLFATETEAPPREIRLGQGR
jgi:glycosyltransferase involved in cell wall biosynthesis